MRYRFLLLSTVAVLGLSTAAPAAEPTPEGADTMVRALTGLLPDSVTKTGFVKAIPEGDHYRLTIDFSKLMELVKTDKGKFNLAMIYDLQVFPPDGPEGLMKVRRDAAPLSINANWEAGTEKGDLSYLIKDVAFDGLFDPAISYFRSASGHSSGGVASSNDGTSKMTASFGPSDYSMTGAANPKGGVDMTTAATISGMLETVSAPEMPPMTFTMDKMALDASFTGVRVREIGELLAYARDHLDEQPLKPETRRGMADRLGKALPLFDAVAEDIRINGLSVAASGVTVKFASAGYRVGFTGVKDDGELQVGLSASEPQITGLPAVMVYGGLIPKTMTMTVSVNGLNLATMANAFIANAEKDLNDPIFAEIGKSVLKDGRMNIDVSEFAATSPLYNISVKGHVETKVDVEPPKATAVFDVTARDLDGTIKGIQELAQSVPDLNTASFGLMMAKGMAKNNPDGTSVWKVEVADDGKVKINGQALPQ